MSLHESLGGMRSIAQWFIWRLEWDAEEGKYLKTPCGMDGSVYRIDASLPSNWTRYESAAARAAELNVGGTAALRYALGFWMTQDCGYWFLDLDKCATAGELTPFAAQMVAAFPGAMMEWSSSGSGVHVFGRTAAGVPPHRSRDIHKMHMEFYTANRGVAFGLTGIAQGNADTLHDAAVAEVVRVYFPPRAAGATGEGGRRPDWRGPEDDDALIERMLSARQSAESAFGGKASVRQLWYGEVEKNSHSDMALASHLAFWTGCDEERIARLMLRSGLVREKWSAHRTYLRELTIARACASCETVYQEPQRSIAVQSEMYGVLPPVSTLAAGVAQEVVSPEVIARMDMLMDLVTGCGTLAEMHNTVIPAIRNASIPFALGDRLVRAVNKQLDMWQAKMQVAKLRALLFPPVVAGTAGGQEVPLWVQKHCYVKDGDYFLDMENGSSLSYQGFCAEYARLMPMKDNGGRENPVDWALNRWGMRTVHKVSYRPDLGPYFDWDGLEYANLYNPNSVPAVAAQYTEAGIAGIAAFQALLWDMCGRRQDVFMQLLWWFAHNVQRPGIKIRWSPIIKGTPGDAKSILSNVLRAAMGYRNVGVTGNSTLRNSGGFNDWAIGYAVNVIEEIWMVGKERHVLYNATKEFIGNDVVSVNGKGIKASFHYNTTNHLAYSNHNDAIPLEKEDRRWLVIFTPWESLSAMYEYAELTGDQWRDRTKAVDNAWRNCGGELRAWFLSVPIGPEFDKDGSAMRTPERELMIASSVEDAEAIAQQIISDGMVGICEEVLSSNRLSQALKIRSMTDGFELPRGQTLNHMLTRMGYSKIPKQVKWNGSTNTIWIKNGFSGDFRLKLGLTLEELKPQ